LHKGLLVNCRPAALEARKRADGTSLGNPLEDAGNLSKLQTTTAVTMRLVLASQDLSELPPVTLGRPALDRPRRLGKALFVAPLSACDAFGSFLVQLSRHARRGPLGRQCSYHDLQPVVADLNVEHLTDPRLACWLYPFAINADSTQIDRLAGQRARLK